MLFGRGVVIVLDSCLRRAQTEVSENRPIAMAAFRPDRKSTETGNICQAALSMVDVADVFGPRRKSDGK